MKVLLIITKSEIGGAQVFVLNLARSLRKLGFEVEVAAGDGDYLFKELQKNNIPYHYLSSLKRNISIFSSFYFIYDSYRLLKAKKYDIVHLNSSNTLFGAVAAYLLRNRPKILFTFHGLSLLDKNYEANFLIRFLTKLYFKIFLKFVDKSVFVSALNYKESQEEGILQNAEVIFNGLNENEINFLSEEEAKKYFSFKCGTDLSSSFLIGSTGRLAYPKNYEFLINNFLFIKKKIPNAKVIIIGEGPDRTKFEELIRKMKIQNDFFLLGAMQDSFMYIKAFDVFTLPSRYEGLSISLMEAVFASIPILASDVGGNSEIVCGCKGQLFRLNDVDDYVIKLIDIQKEKQHLMEYNKGLKINFSLDKMVISYKNLYELLSKER